jgi:peptidoglycan hydrolase-like protein with peptidoglycan-binding domain
MTNSLQLGSRGPTVSALQAKLNTMLVPSPRLVADGSFGPKTAQAVKAFQQMKRLVADGVVGPKTAAALGLSLGGSSGPAPARYAPPGAPPPPGAIPPPGGAPPAAGPPGFVDLSVFNVVIEAVIAGYQKIGSRLLSWIDSDYVPQFVYDRVAATVNAAVNMVVSPLRAISHQTVPLGQDPAAYVTSRIRDGLARGASSLSAALQPLVGLPVIGIVASGYQRNISGLMGIADVALANLKHNGQSAQAVATRIAAAFDAVARQIG